MARLIDVDAFRREFGFAEECRDCKRDAKWKCDSQMYSARDICGWLDDTPIVTEWISVKDRMPPNDDTKVLTYGDPVTHWMPLPEPPEKETRDD